MALSGHSHLSTYSLFSVLEGKKSTVYLCWCLVCIFESVSLGTVWEQASTAAIVREEACITWQWLHRSGIPASAFFPRELFTLGLWFLAQLFREILGYIVTELCTKLWEKLYRLKCKGISRGVNSCLVPVPFLCLFTVCSFSTSVSGWLCGHPSALGRGWMRNPPGAQTIGGCITHREFKNLLELKVGLFLNCHHAQQFLNTVSEKKSFSGLLLKHWSRLQLSFHNIYLCFALAHLNDLFNKHWILHKS